MDDAEILNVRRQFQAGQWPQFLEMVEIQGLRGWTGQMVEFRFPVVAIVGENGSGKSTLLKTAACAYIGTPERFYPSVFFMKTHWDVLADVKLNYRIKQGATTKTYKISKLARWNFSKNMATRGVLFLDTARTLPLDATVGYVKIAKAATAEIETIDIEEEYRRKLSLILGRDYQNARFAKPNVDPDKEIGLLRLAFGEVSQFHQGAGESATLELFRQLQNIPQYTLLIIDEVEGSLHPKAQRRLIRFLLWLSRQKRLQIVLSTHSPYVLEELPSEARVLLLPGQNAINVIYGVSTEFALSAIDEPIHPELAIFVEDEAAATYLREILASDVASSKLLQRIHIYPVGPANVVQMLGHLAFEGKLPYRSLSFLDGDYPASPGCALLPGNAAPERTVYQNLKAQAWGGLDQRFGIGAGTLLTYFEDAMLHADHHTWNTLIGDRITMASKTVWQVLCNHWAMKCLGTDERDRVAAAIEDAMVA